jgi:hydrogenase nickel incorporation protein HypA/HybF
MREKESTMALFARVVQKSSAARTKAVFLGLGEVAELDPEAVRRHWVELSKGTPLERAQLHIRLIRAEAQCMACFKKYHPVNGRIHCPNCGSFGAKILSGEEFHVEHIETNDE